MVFLLPLQLYQSILGFVQIGLFCLNLFISFEEFDHFYLSHRNESFFDAEQWRTPSIVEKLFGLVHQEVARVRMVRPFFRPAVQPAVARAL